MPEIQIISMFHLELLITMFNTQRNVYNGLFHLSKEKLLSYLYNKIRSIYSERMHVHSLLRAT